MAEIDFEKLSFEEIADMKSKVTIPTKQRDINLNDDNFLANFAIISLTSFNSHGAPETIYQNLTDRQLIDRFLTVDFTQITDIEIKNYFQEMHNRIAKKMGIPAVEVTVKENSKISYLVTDEQIGSFIYAAPIELIYDINSKTPNMGIIVSEIMNKDREFLPSVAGVDYLISLFHETRHLQQIYAANKLFQKSSQELHDDYLNSVAFLEILQRITNAYFKNTEAIYPKIQSPENEDMIKSLQSYFLQAHEIDARKFSIEQMELLANKGLLQNTNWNKYKYSLYFNEYLYLNELKKSSSDICPAISFEKRLCEKAMRKMKVASKPAYEKLDAAFKKIDFNVFVRNLQKYYEHLKHHLKTALADTQKNFIATDKDFEYFSKKAVENMTKGYSETLSDHAIYGVIHNIFYSQETSRIYINNEDYNKHQYIKNKEKKQKAAEPELEH